jgi:hypothetical protein
MRNVPVQTAVARLGVGADPPFGTEHTSDDSLASYAAVSQLDSNAEPEAKRCSGSVQGMPATTSVTSRNDGLSRSGVKGDAVDSICPPWVKEVFLQAADPFDDGITVVDRHPHTTIAVPTVDSVFFQYFHWKT